MRLRRLLSPRLTPGGANPALTPPATLLSFRVGAGRALSETLRGSPRRATELASRLAYPPDNHSAESAVVTALYFFSPNPKLSAHIVSCIGCPLGGPWRLLGPWPLPLPLALLWPGPGLALCTLSTPFAPSQAVRTPVLCLVHACPVPWRSAQPKLSTRFTQNTSCSACVPWPCLPGFSPFAPTKPRCLCLFLAHPWP